MKTDIGYFDRSTIAQYIGTFLFIGLLESHIVSRPRAFLLGPWLICLCLTVADGAEFRSRWTRVVPIAGVFVNPLREPLPRATRFVQRRSM
jgi:hypothetical protein